MNCWICRNVNQRGSPEVQKQLIEVYKNFPQLAHLCELLVDFDEGLQEWRYRHVKMVERTIGTKRGTGNSDGAAYLKKTLFQPIFPDLWAIRSELWKKVLRQKVSWKVLGFQLVAQNTVSGEKSDGSPELRFGGNFKQTLR